MFLGEPSRTAYDLQFPVAGVPVRVTPWFWLAATLLGFDLVAGLDRGLPNSPGQGLLLLLWIAAVFISILVHELGHSLAMRYYGIRSYVVLYHFGGLAVPDSMAAGWGRSKRSGNQIVISAAGPAAQILLVAILFLLVRLAGYRVLCPPILFLGDILPIGEGPSIPSVPLDLFVLFLLIPSIFWALLNLLPVYPLDGGQIAREILTLFNPQEGIKNSLVLSIVTGGGVALYALMHRDIFLAIMFGLLAYSSYTTLQAYSGRGGGFGGGRPW